MENQKKQADKPHTEIRTHSHNQNRVPAAAAAETAVGRLPRVCPGVVAAGVLHSLERPACPGNSHTTFLMTVPLRAVIPWAASLMLSFSKGRYTLLAGRSE